MDTLLTKKPKSVSKFKYTSENNPLECVIIS